LVLLALILGVSAAMLVVLGSRLSFFNDDWYFLLQRPGLVAHSGAGVWLAPHNGHFVVLQVALYKALVDVFGLGAQWPHRVAVAFAVCALSAVVFVLVSGRAGRLLGLLAAISISFLGSGSEALFTISAFNLAGSLACGLGALLALEQRSRRRDALACGLLVTATCLANLSLAFVAAAAVSIALRKRARDAWVPAVPLAIFAIWWVAYGSDAPSAISLANVRGLPSYVLRSASSGLASLTGASEIPGVHGPWPGYLLLGLLAAAAVWRLLRRPRPSGWLLVPLTAALAFWCLSGLNYIPGRDPQASRYQLIDATFLLVIVAELFRPVRLRFVPLAAAVALGAGAIVLNGLGLRDGYRFFYNESANAKGALGALELVGRRAPPGMGLSAGVTGNTFMTGITAGRYFAVSSEHGRPAVLDARQIEHAPVTARRVFDGVAAVGYGVLLLPVERHETAGCARAETARGTSRVEAALPPGGARIVDLGGAPRIIGIRRVAPPALPTVMGLLRARGAAELRIPPDRVRAPWRLSATGTTAIVVCPLRG
jgi:hypothetical protein